MAPLATNLRRDLERAIIEARKAAERGARSALGALTVPETKAGRHLDASGRDLRNRLRAHARQLGDKRSIKGEQAIDRLMRECAYEHWHRMLFARFLAENDLLIEPESGVSVSLDDVEELAREQGAKPWPLAASYAQLMLPQIFRADDPVLAIDLPTETGLRLESLLEDLPRDVFTADDSLGWTYQFWQAAEKDAVNDRVKSGEKITGETLPAVTQLFTEHYMVLFLLHNTIGAWHAGKTLTETQMQSAGSEQEFRDAVCLAPLGGYDFEYLRFVREPMDGEDPDKGSGPWRPAAGTYDGWPKSAAALRVLDPCCGSGHFVVAAFDLLVRLRVAEEGLSTHDAIRAVLADNLFGLELDPRCTQIAAFNLALAAWKLAGKPIDLPLLHIACSGIGPQSTREEWLKMAEGTLANETAVARQAIQRGLIHMHELFSDAPELGSLIDPNELPDEGFAADFETLRPVLDAVLSAELDDDDAHERAVAAQGMAKAAAILSGRRSDGDEGYTLVLTNVPYLGRGSQSDLLKSFAEANYKEAKADLATIFAARMFRWAGRDEHAGTVAAVTPQNWLFLTSYKKFRERLLKDRAWNIVARLGPGAFETIGGHVVNVALLSLSGGKAPGAHIMTGIDVSTACPATAKAALLRGETGADAPPSGEDEQNAPPGDSERTGSTVRVVAQADQLKNPDCVVSFARLAGELLSVHAYSTQGLKTGDDEQWRRSFWEIDASSERWRFLQSSIELTTPYGGRQGVIDWANDGEGMARLQGMQAWGRPGVAIKLMGRLPATLHTGEIFDSNVSPITPADPEALIAIWTYCASGEFAQALRRLNTKLNVAEGSVVKVPFDLDHWTRVAAEEYPDGLPDPQSSDPTQWLFHGHPALAHRPTVLQVGVARLAGYRWPAELDENMRLAPDARELVGRCDELLDFADEDGVVCLSPVRGEGSAANRLRRLLAAVFGSEWSAAKERELLQAAADQHNKGKVARSLDDWLRDRFFVEHCTVFHHRPFVWHIWDGRKDGFNALVNYHRLAESDGRGRKLLESLTYSYLGDWIKRQEDGVKSDEAGAEARLAAAVELKEQLEKVLAGEPPYDTFVRWKPLCEQPIGWEPDINDGVRMNIRPFMLAKDMRETRGQNKGSGILRWTPSSIKWTKDRGKEPQTLRPREEFPWFWGWDEKTPNFTGGAKFDGHRWNDLHYTNAFKQAARERASEEATP